jgi:hypothetical protein
VPPPNPAADAAGDPVRPELTAAIDRCWDELSRPGTWWDAAGRRAIAEVARAAIGGGVPPAVLLPAAAAEAATRIAATPAEVDEAWVHAVCEAIGETRYVELVGIVARVVAVDTFQRLLGLDVRPLSEPQPGQPTREAPPTGARRNHTWVSMVTPVPPYVLGAVPAAMTAMNDLTDQLYMPPDEMGDPDWRRGDLHRTQIELVAATVSLVNECFY